MTGRCVRRIVALDAGGRRPDDGPRRPPRAHPSQAGPILSRGLLAVPGPLTTRPVNFKVGPHAAKDRRQGLGLRWRLGTRSDPSLPGPARPEGSSAGWHDAVRSPTGWAVLRPRSGAPRRCGASPSTRPAPDAVRFLGGNGAGGGTIRAPSRIIESGIDEALMQKAEDRRQKRRSSERIIKNLGSAF